MSRRGLLLSLMAFLCLHRPSILADASAVTVGSLHPFDATESSSLNE
jgi:hypothetical protein